MTRLTKTFYILVNDSSFVFCFAAAAPFLYSRVALLP